MGERSALGRPGGAGGELDVDGIVELKQRLQPGQLGTGFRRGTGGDFGEGEGTGAGTADLDDPFEGREACGAELAGSGGRKLGRKFGQQADVVAGLEARRGDEGAAADLVEGELQFDDPVGRVDVDQDDAGLGGAELSCHPLAVVQRPDADAVATPQAQRQQPRRTRRHAPPARGRSNARLGSER